VELTDRAKLESRAQRLVGQRLTAIRYLQIDYGDDEPYWRLDEWDCLDYGFEIETDSGLVFCITWDNAFSAMGWGLSILERSYDLGECRVWDVTQGSRWASVIGHKLAEATIYWEHDLFDGLLYPQDIVLTFDSGQHVYAGVYVCGQDKRPLFPMADEVLVVFSDETAQELGIGPYINWHLTNADESGQPRQGEAEADLALSRAEVDQHFGDASDAATLSRMVAAGYRLAAVARLQRLTGWSLKEAFDYIESIRPAR
jgi:hypothetical protein